MTHAIYITTVKVTYTIDTEKKKGIKTECTFTAIPLILRIGNENVLPPASIASLGRMILTDVNKKTHRISIIKYTILHYKFSSKINYNYE